MRSTPFSMQTATCVLCQERVNLLTHKLVSVQWVEPKSGALLSLSFHSDCYVRWYRETARSTQRESTPATESPRKEGPLTTPAPARPLLPSGDSPEKHLSPVELQRLERLRGRSDADATGLSGSARSEIHAEEHLDEPNQPDKDPPQEDQPEDGHDVAPPHV